MRFKRAKETPLKRLTGGAMDLDDLQVLRNNSRLLSEVVREIYQAFTEQGLPEDLCHELTLISFQQMQAAALQDQMAKIFRDVHSEDDL